MGSEMCIRDSSYSIHSFVVQTETTFKMASKTPSTINKSNSISSTPSSVIEHIMQNPEVDIDLYGRGFDGIFGPGAEQIGRQEALLRLKGEHDRKTAVRPGNFVDRDLYGRGDPRIFGAAAFIGNENKDRSAQPRNHPRRRVVFVKAGLLGKIADKLRSSRQAEDEEDYFVPLESMSPIGSGHSESTPQVASTKTTTDVPEFPTETTFQEGESGDARRKAPVGTTISFEPTSDLKIETTSIRRGRVSNLSLIHI